MNTPTVSAPTPLTGPMLAITIDTPHPQLRSLDRARDDGRDHGDGYRRRERDAHIAPTVITLPSPLEHVEERKTVSVFADEAELLRRAQEGDGDAFSSLLQTNDRAMRACAWQLLGNQSLMDDALQDAYIKAYRSLDTFRSESKFSSWLYRIVYRTCLDHQRYRSRRPSVPLIEDGQTLPAAEASAARSDTTERLAQRYELQDALAQLPPDQAAVVIMVDAEGLTYDQVGAALDLPKGTIASRLSRARAALRQLLTPPASESAGRFDEGSL